MAGLVLLLSGLVALMLALNAQPVNLRAAVQTDSHRRIARSGPKPTPPGIIPLGALAVRTGRRARSVAG
jgi:hypothetical protein